MTDSARPIRVLVAKPGLDGHDTGAKLICRALMDAGMQAFYTGLRQSPDAIAEAAREHKVDVVGLSILSGAHLSLVRKVVEALERSGMANVLLIVGGNIPENDVHALQEAGVAGVFPTGTPFAAIVEFLHREVTT
jgi:methylmalonyl-CoA mutase C-terminal domain/subunit